MSYFSDNYDKLTYPVGVPGFREAQLAAIQAIAAHFFSSSTPAIAVMPTGAGKTAVAVATAFALRAKRVLVITPSRLLREQITEKFETLVDLEKIQALPPMMERPKVRNQRKRVKSEDDWSELRNYDVVVSTVFGISGLDGSIPDIPEDLFDLVIVDEAHHSPAATWTRALKHLSAAKQLLLTATPFRRDARKIKGRIVFTYDIKRAYEDEVFGDLTFRPANPVGAEGIDLAIARETEAQFKEDAAAGLQHLVMVRVDGIERGRELEKVYAETSLRLKFISGQSSLAAVKKANEELRSGELDGIICVNMFGEGFDLPRLKIAALHSPHKSLAVTLQFIGRFARTTESRIGKATFVAFPEEQRKEIQELWTTSAIWPEIVHNISSIRIEKEKFAQEVYETFDEPISPEIADLPLNILKPYFHVKIFALKGLENPTAIPVSQRHRRLVFSASSDEKSISIFIERYVSTPKWISDEVLEDAIHHLSIMYYEKARQLYFVASTDKTVSNYDRILRVVGAVGPSELSASRINRALNGIEGLRFFNLGMRKKLFGGRTESYRILAGPSADNVVSELDGQSYYRGHSFGKGRLNGEDVTIGISTSSKIWSNFVGPIPDFITWCEELGSRLDAKEAQKTGSGLDRLSAGQPIDEFPSAPVYSYLAADTYIAPPTVFADCESSSEIGQLCDFDIEILSHNSSVVALRFRGIEWSWDGEFVLGRFPSITPLEESEVEPFVGRLDDRVPISEYLSEFVPQFRLENFDIVDRDTLLEANKSGETLSAETFTIIDWKAEKINIEMEKPQDGEAKALSIFDWVRSYLENRGCVFVFNDDGAGEVADFISLEILADEIWISFFHCKASGAESAGSRLQDIYDVSGQAIRSGIWLSGRRLVDQLKRRMGLSGVIGIENGTLETFSDVFSPSSFQKLRFRNVIVQPGISASKIRERPEQVLVATGHSVIAAGFHEFRIFCSK